MTEEELKKLIQLQKVDMFTIRDEDRVFVSEYAAVRHAVSELHADTFKYTSRLSFEALLLNEDFRATIRTTLDWIDVLDSMQEPEE